MSQPSLVSTDATALQSLIATRRSVFQFQDRPVPEDALMRALDAARWAPNHKMTQPWRFVIPGPELNAKLKQFFAQRLVQKMQARGFSAAEIELRQQQPTADIPAQVLVYSRRTGDAYRQQEDYAATCCAVQNLMLAAWSEGIASGWKSFDHAEGYALFELDPAEVQIVGLIQLGYALRERGAQRQPLAELITYTA
ncbi:MAG: nitroreductase family protein [Candidatus Sericytochromatia bacterium]